MFAHVFAEERGIGEAQFDADLRGGQFGVLQIVDDVLNDVFRNPFRGRLSADGATDSGEVFGRDKEFLGIDSDTEFLDAAAGNVLQKLMEELFHVRVAYSR